MVLRTDGRGRSEIVVKLGKDETPLSHRKIATREIRDDGPRVAGLACVPMVRVFPGPWRLAVEVNLRKTQTRCSRDQNKQCYAQQVGDHFQGWDHEEGSSEYPLRISEPRL